jgi:hypothetical protein
MGNKYIDLWNRWGSYSCIVVLDMIIMNEVNEMRNYIFAIWEFCKEYPGWAAAFFFCGWLLGATIKNSMIII